MCDTQSMLNGFACALIYTRQCAHVSVHTRVSTHTNAHALLCCVCSCGGVHVYVCVYVPIRVFVCVDGGARGRKYAHMHQRGMETAIQAHASGSPPISPQSIQISTRSNHFPLVHPYTNALGSSLALIRKADVHVSADHVVHAPSVHICPNPSASKTH